MEIGGETLLNALIPYNVNTNSVRQRFWDGQDKLLRDDLTMLKGNHLLGFGGAYQRNFDYVSRTDNGNGVNDQIVYQMTSTGINFTNSPYIPATVPSSQYSNYESLVRRGSGNRQPAAGDVYPLGSATQPAAGGHSRHRQGRSSRTTACTSTTPGTRSPVSP